MSEGKKFCGEASSINSSQHTIYTNSMRQTFRCGAILHSYLSRCTMTFEGTVTADQGRTSPVYSHHGRRIYSSTRRRRSLGPSHPILSAYWNRSPRQVSSSPRRPYPLPSRNPKAQCPEYHVRPYSRPLEHAPPLTSGPRSHSNRSRSLRV